MASKGWLEEYRDREYRKQLQAWFDSCEAWLTADTPEMQEWRWHCDQYLARTLKRKNNGP